VYERYIETPKTATIRVATNSAAVTSTALDATLEHHPSPHSIPSKTINPLYTERNPEVLKGLTTGLARGTNAMGHPGWLRVRCRVCATLLDLSGQKPRAARRFQPVYYCPKCAGEYGAYFCSADARALKYECPFCRTRLELATPLPEE